MWFVFLKILFLCLYLTNNVNSYEYSSYKKTSYSNDKWKYVGGGSSSTERNLRQDTTISPYNINSNVHLRHNRFHNLGKVWNRLNHMTTSTPSYKNIKHNKRDDQKDDYDFMADDNYDDQEYEDEVEDDEDEWVSDI